MDRIRKIIFIAVVLLLIISSTIFISLRPVAAQTYSIQITPGSGSGQGCMKSSNCYNPDSVSVSAGTAVTWTNTDNVGHTVTSGHSSDNQTGTIFDSSLIRAGGTFSFTFNSPGTYPYFCSIHPWMTGQIVVVSATSLNEMANRTVSVTLPSAPAMLTATAVSSSQINLSWTAPSNNGGSSITGYKIERSTDGGTTWSTVMPNTGSTSTTYSDTQLNPSTPYTYRVSAINSVGTSPPSNTVSVTTPNIPATIPTTTATPGGGTYATSQTVTLTSDHPATIYYTTDGTDPTTSSASGPSPLALPQFTSTITLKFFAVDASGNREPVKTETYAINIPVSSPSNQSTSQPSTSAVGTVSTDKKSYYTGENIIISGQVQNYSPNIGVAITIKNPIGNLVHASQPDVGGDGTYATTVATGGQFWQIPGTYTVSAFYGNNLLDKTDFNFALQKPPIPTTTATPGGGTYATSQTVTLTSDHPATIYYTTDGTDPTTSSASGPSPLALPQFTSTITLKFFAVDASGNREPVKTETYTIIPLGVLIAGTVAIGTGIAVAVKLSIAKGISVVSKSALHSSLHSVKTQQPTDKGIPQTSSIPNIEIEIRVGIENGGEKPSSQTEISDKVGKDLELTFDDIIKENGGLDNLHGITTIMNWYDEHKQALDKLSQDQLDNTPATTNILNLALEERKGQDSFRSKLLSIVVEKIMSQVSVPFVDTMIDQIKIKTKGKKKSVMFNADFTRSIIKPYIEFILKINGQKVASTKIDFEIDIQATMKDIKFEYAKDSRKIDLGSLEINLTVSANFKIPLTGILESKQIGQKSFDIDLSKFHVSF